MFSSRIILSTPLKIIYVLVAFFCVRILYMMFFRPMKRVEDYIYRSNSWIRFFQMYDKALSVLEGGIERGGFDELDKQRLFFSAGVVYSLKRDYRRAVECFEQLDSFWKRERIDFDSNFYVMLVSYENDGRKLRAKELFRLLLRQEKHDPRFSQLRDFM